VNARPTYFKILDFSLCNDIFGFVAWYGKIKKSFLALRIRGMHIPIRATIAG
jgi:hypothetical protein